MVSNQYGSRRHIFQPGTVDDRECKKICTTTRYGYDTFAFLRSLIACSIRFAPPPDISPAMLIFTGDYLGSPNSPEHSDGMRVEVTQVIYLWILNGK